MSDYIAQLSYKQSFLLGQTMSVLHEVIELLENDCNHSAKDKLKTFKAEFDSAIEKLFYAKPSELP